MTSWQCSCQSEISKGNVLSFLTKNFCKSLRSPKSEDANFSSKKIISLWMFDRRVTINWMRCGECLIWPYFWLQNEDKRHIVQLRCFMFGLNCYFSSYIILYELLSKFGLNGFTKVPKLSSKSAKLSSKWIIKIMSPFSKPKT